MSGRIIRYNDGAGKYLRLDDRYRLSLAQARMNEKVAFRKVRIRIFLFAEQNNSARHALVRNALLYLGTIGAVTDNLPPDIKPLVNKN